MRRVLALIVVIVLALVAGPSRLPPVFGPDGGRITIKAEPVQLNPDGGKALLRVGELTYLRGWSLTSSSSEFGGLSALRAWRDGWIAVMDTGGFVRFSPYNPDAEITPVNPRCLPNRVRLGYDLEGLDTDGTHIWVSSEWHNTICRIDPDGRQFGIRPPGMAHWPRRSGPETLLRLRDGRFLILPEDARHDALLFPRDPVSGTKPRALRYTPPKGYMPTDAAELPDGRIVILNRDFGWRGFATKIVLLDRIPERGIIKGRVIATLAKPLIHDNFEGIAARREGDATILTIVSDDNFNSWQQTLLLEFRLDT